MRKPCIRCGVLSEESYCPEHAPKDERRGRVRDHVGRDGAWDRLSKRARALQPWCSTCGTRDDLTTDHTPRAWARIALRLPVRLHDVQVLCRSCNAALGPAQPGSKRYNDWLQEANRGGTRGVSEAEKGCCAPGVVPEPVTSTSGYR